MRIPRSRRDQRRLSRRNHRSRERITRRPSSKLSRASHASLRPEYIGRISPRFSDFVERRWAEEEVRESEEDGRDARKRSFVSGSVGTTRRSPNDGATIELCISHETLRETAPFVIHGTWEQCARVQQSFFSDKISLLTTLVRTFGFTCRALIRSPFKTVASL